VPAPEKGHGYEPLGGLVYPAELEGKGRYVAVDVDCCSPEVMSDPLVALPLVRTVAWAAQWVTQDGDADGEVRATDASDITERGGPLLNEADLGELQAISLHPIDICAAVARATVVRE
jgi:hypothetical protein